MPGNKGVKSMECEKVRDQFSALLERDITHEEERALREHLASCSECHEDFERFNKTINWLHSVEEVGVPEGFLSGIYKKIEDRKEKAPSSEKALWSWVKHPLHLKLPLQAAGMVATVFLVIYITKMMPIETPHLKETSESKPSFSLEKRGEVKVDQGLPQKMIQNERKAPAPPTQTEVPREEMFHSKDVEKPAFRVSELERGKMRKELVAKGKAPLSEKPFPDIIFKTSDQEKAVPQIQELIQQFKGKLITLEGNILFVSLPASSFLEFENKLGALSLSSKPDLVTPQIEPRGELGTATGMKRKKFEGKEEEMADRLTDREGYIAVRIVLIQD
jgi:hypothetical protein